MFSSYMFLSSLYFRFQSGSASLSGRASYHPGPSVGRWPDREHVHHDGGDDGPASTANGMQKDMTLNEEKNKKPVNVSVQVIMFVVKETDTCFVSFCNYKSYKTDFLFWSVGINVYKSINMLFGRTSLTY